MNAIERKRYILDELQRNGSVVITDLAERIQVSSMTIRPGSERYGRGRHGHAGTRRGSTEQRFTV